MRSCIFRKKILMEGMPPGVQVTEIYGKPAEVMHERRASGLEIISDTACV